jgi:exonuclease III
MKKTANAALMTAMMMAAATGYDPYFSLGRPRRERTKEQKQRWLKELGHKMNPVDLSEREFVIHGETIMAHDRKTALKIYANRHPELKRKKK